MAEESADDDPNSRPSDERDVTSESDDSVDPGDTQREETLREQVEDTYDFDDFGPGQMAEISAEEWEAAFDEDSWITGEELLDRVESDLRAHVERRDVFAVIERDILQTDSGPEPVVLAYSDEGYAVVYPDGSVEGRGTVSRDVKPIVALCSMPDYDPEEPSGDGTLPDPETVSGSGSELGNRVMQIVGVVQLLAGIILLGAWFVYALSVIVPVVAVGFLLFGTFVLGLVANARLADRFRAEEYRERLRSARVNSDDRPAFVPGSDAEPNAELDDQNPPE